MPMGGAMIGGAAIGGVTSLVGSGKQADATKYAANLQSQAQANSLAFNQQVYNNTKANQAPYVAAGQQAINNLSTETAPGGSLNTPWTQPFSFSGVNLQNDPAYQFDLNQGQQAIQRSAAAQGGLVSGGALKDLNDYSQGYASNQFQQSYANALGQYQQAYNIFQNNQSNSFNRQAAVAGIGQTGTSSLAGAGATAANNFSNTALQGAAAAGNYLTQGAVAQSAGLAGVGNAITNGINQYANNYLANGGSSYGGTRVSNPDSWDSYSAVYGDPSVPALNYSNLSQGV